MAYNLVVKEEALSDTLEAFLYYEDKSEGLGERFMTALQMRYDQISQNPEHYSFTDKRKVLRDVKLKGFPYVVIYDVVANNITVYVVHNSHKRSPANE